MGGFRLGAPPEFVPNISAHTEFNISFETNSVAKGDGERLSKVLH